MSSFFITQKNLRDPYFQLAWEEALALEMPNWGIQWGVRIWRNQKTIVLGISEKESLTIQKHAIDDFKKKFPIWKQGMQNSENRHDRIRKDTFIARRASGGGTVFHDWPGNLNFSLFVDISKKPELYPIPKSYEVLLGIVRNALAKQGCIATTAGKSDISIYSQDGSLKKISGNAQFRKKHTIVQHGTLILDPLLFQKVESFQLHPPEEPNYRMKRSHREFLTHIKTQLDENRLALDIGLELESIFLPDSDGHSNPDKSIGNENPLSNFPDKNPGFFSFLKASIRRANQLRVQKYATQDWIFRG